MPLLGSIYKLLTFLVRYTRHIPRAHLVGGGIIAASVASGLANTALVALVNRVINAPNPGPLLLPFLGVCLLFPLLRYVGDRLLAGLTAQATVQLRMTLASRVLAVPLRRLEELGASRLNVTLLEDLPTVIGAMTLIPLLSLNLTVVAGCLLYMGLLSWKMLMGVLLFLVLGVVAYQLPLIRGHQHVRALRASADELFRHMRALTDGIKELKLHGGRRNAFLNERLRTTATEVQQHSVAAQRAFSSAVSWGQVLIFLLIGVVAFALPAVAEVERSVLTGYTFAILYMVGPVQVLLNSVASLTRAVTAMDRVDQMGLQLEEAAREGVSQLLPPTAGETATTWSSVEFAGATHSYYSERDGAVFTLGPIDMTFRPGEIVFITGGNGSGKTTLAKLITGLYTPEDGELRLDGVPVKGPAALERYHSLFAVVFSDFYLFDSLLGMERPQMDADARQYLELLQLDHKVTIEGGTLSTTDLSQGQRKRLALLTAYMEDRPIYLFDEWAADQDPHFKHVFYHELLPRLRERGKTVFAISHDDRFYHVADRLIKLDYGRVVLDARMEGEGLPEEVQIAGPAVQPVGQGV